MSGRPGLHWPNTTEDLPDARERFTRGRFTNAVIMTVTPPSVAAWLTTQTKILVARIYEPAGDLPAAADIDARYNNWIHQSGVTYVQLLNEPDLEYPSRTPEQFAAWWNLCAALLRHAHPTIKLVFPAPSVGADPTYLERIHLAGGLRQADAIGERAYWQPEHDMYDPQFGNHWQRSLPYRKPIILTEFGCSDPDTTKSAKVDSYLTYAATLPRFVIPAGLFIGAGGDPQWDTPEAGRLWVDDPMSAKFSIAEGEHEMDPAVEAHVRTYADLITTNAHANQIPPSIVAGLIAVESGGHPDATSPDNGPGLGHAVGLMQVLEGHFTKDEEPYDPATNIRVGTTFLRSKIQAFGGRIGSGLAAYFGAVDKDGNPTTATDLTGTNGITYVALIDKSARTFADLDKEIGPLPPRAQDDSGPADPDFATYAPQSGTWREAAVNLKGIADDALATGRKLVADVATTWGQR